METQEQPNTIPTSITIAALPALGAPLADGTFRGIVTAKDGTHNAVVEVKNHGRMPWQKAKEAMAPGTKLPSKAEAALIAANSEMDDAWYWTEEEYSASDAWVFNSSGSTNIDDKSAAGGALSVRLIPITA